jgi:hypothetical protein
VIKHDSFIEIESKFLKYSRFIKTKRKKGGIILIIIIIIILKKTSK